MRDFIKKVVDSVDGASFGEDSTVKRWVSTGNYALNRKISGSYSKGIPVGRVLDVFGDPSTGKSLLIYHIIANVQKMGGIAILDDTEDAYTKEFGEKIGIDNEELIQLSSLTVEEHFEKVFLGWKDKTGRKRPPIVKSILEHDPECLILVALDSLALLSTKHELQTKFDKPDMLKAKHIRAGLRMASEVMQQGNIIHLISNHITSKIGVMFGPTTTTPGGSGVPFSASVRIELSKGAKIKGKIDEVEDTNESKEDSENEDNEKSKAPIIGVQSFVHIPKNKIAALFQRSIVDIYFDRGLDPYSGLLEAFIDDKLVVKSGRGVYLYINKETSTEEKFKQKDFIEFIDSHKELKELLVC